MSHDTSATRRGIHLLYASTAALITVFALLAGIALGAEYALPIILLGVIVLGFFAANELAARRSLDRHDGDARATQADETETVPTAHAIADGAALGDTAEAHAEISPVDLPPDAPGLEAARAQAAARERGTTRGDRDGAQGGARLGDDEEAPPSTTEGYEADQPTSSPYAR